MVIFFPVFNKNGRKLFVHVTYNEQLHLTNITITLEYSHFTNSLSSGDLNTVQKNH